MDAGVRSPRSIQLGDAVIVDDEIWNQTSRRDLTFMRVKWLGGMDWQNFNETYSTLEKNFCNNFFIRVSRNGFFPSCASRGLVRTRRRAFRPHCGALAVPDLC